ncbi:MAG: site-specific DNA-methyltransferase [Clostridia bacterium]|nr:site-specific DNA-methyltransferase [Clostridia bacterium]
MKIQLLHGDCLQLMKQIPDGSVDMVLTDPPYGTTDCEWDTDIDPKAMWKQLTRVLKPNGAAAVFFQLPFGIDLINANRDAYRYELIWKKTMATGFLNSQKMPLRAHENIAVFYRTLPTFNPQMTPSSKPARGSRKHGKPNETGKVYSKQGRHECEWQDNGMRYPTDVITSNNNFNGMGGCLKGGTQRFHPTQKPVPLLKYLIKTYTNRGETVLDCFMGSGSTGVACASTGRNFIGIEMDDHYFDVAKERIEKRSKANET